MDRDAEQRRNRDLIINYLANRSEIRATELAAYVSKKTGTVYSPIAAARVMGNLGWHRTILNVAGPGDNRIKMFRRY